MKTNMEMKRGDTLSFAVQIEFDEDVQELDTVFFTCKTNYNDNTPVFQKRLGNGISLSSQEGNTLYYIVRVDPKDTANIEAGQYYYDMQITVNDDVFTILDGIINIDNDVTKWGVKNE